LFCHYVLQFCRIKKKKWHLTFLLAWDKGSLWREFPYDISMYICI
jgi:hypothetical protein